MFDAPALVSRLSSSIDYNSRKDSRNSVERAKILLSRLGRADEMWAGVQRLLPETPIDEVSQLEEVCDTLAVVAGKMAPRIPNYTVDLRKHHCPVTVQLGASVK